MKRIIIGRGIDCDIVIPDEKDNVSRHHLVISFGLLGKMTISDTSSNGTFVNDRKLLKGASVPVTREDKVRLGSQWTLDWSLVKDPYVATRRILLGAAIFVCWYSLVGVLGITTRVINLRQMTMWRFLFPRKRNRMMFGRKILPIK